VLGVALAACSQPSRPAVPLKVGMSEQQVVEVSNKRVPDRVIARTCGNETAAPFPCKIYVYEGAWRGGRYHPKVSVVSRRSGESGSSVSGSDGRRSDSAISETG
jgi:hypothetical protein